MRDYNHRLCNSKICHWNILPRWRIVLHKLAPLSLCKYPSVSGTGTKYTSPNATWLTQPLMTIGSVSESTKHTSKSHVLLLCFLRCLWSNVLSAQSRKKGNCSPSCKYLLKMKRVQKWEVTYFSVIIIITKTSWTGQVSYTCQAGSFCAQTYAYGRMSQFTNKSDTECFVGGTSNRRIIGCTPQWNSIVRD